MSSLGSPFAVSMVEVSLSPSTSRLFCSPRVDLQLFAGCGLGRR